MAALKERGRIDAYAAARRCQGVSVPEAGRALHALVDRGGARQIEDGGCNDLASVFELTGQ